MKLIVKASFAAPVEYAASQVDLKLQVSRAKATRKRRRRREEDTAIYSLTEKALDTIVRQSKIA